MNLFTPDLYQDHPDPLRTALGQVDPATALVQLAAVRGLAHDGAAAELVLHCISKCLQALGTVAAQAEHACPITYPEVREMLAALAQTQAKHMRAAA